MLILELCEITEFMLSIWFLFSLVDMIQAICVVVGVMSFGEPSLFGFTSCLRSKIVVVLLLGERCNSQSYKSCQPKWSWANLVKFMDLIL